MVTPLTREVGYGSAGSHLDSSPLLTLGLQSRIVSLCRMEVLKSSFLSQVNSIHLSAGTGAVGQGLLSAITAEIG